MEFLPYLLLLAVLIGGYPLYQRYRERQLERKIKEAGNDKNLILSELDMHIQQTSKEAEIFKRNRSR